MLAHLKGISLDKRDRGPFGTGTFTREDGKAGLRWLDAAKKHYHKIFDPTFQWLLPNLARDFGMPANSREDCDA